MREQKYYYDARYILREYTTLKEIIERDEQQDGRDARSRDEWTKFGYELWLVLD